MKLPSGRLDAFLRAPPSEYRAALFFGPDAGLVRERADKLAAAICADLRDPFRVAVLTGAALAADPARLADEVAAQSLSGGRRVIRLRDAPDGLAPLLAEVVAAARGDGLIILEGGDLPPRSALRKLAEAAREIAAIPCYADGARDIATVAREIFAARRIAASGDVFPYLAANLGGDRLVTRSELEKLALYAGDGGRVELADAVACIGDSTALSLEELVFAAAEGEAGRLEAALLRCFQEGLSPVAILRAALRHFQRLHLAAARIAAGAHPDEALRALRPPVFFKLQDRFKAQLLRWPPRRAAAALETLLRAELNSKRTVLPQETVAREALFTLARAATAAARR